VYNAALRSWVLLVMMDKKNALAFDDIKVHVRFKLFASCTWFVFHGPDCRIVGWGEWLPSQFADGASIACLPKLLNRAMQLPSI